MDLPGEKLLIKLAELLSSGAGTAVRPWVTRRDARAEALAAAESRRIERLAQEQLRQDLRDVRAGRKIIGNDLRLLSAPDSAPMDDEAKQIREAKQKFIASINALGLSPQRYLEIEQMINLNQIASAAFDEAASDETGDADPTPVDPDWFSQWRNRAQDVSNEEMQRLWARVLKEETKTTQSFSIHTMDFLSRMSRADAELISTLGSFALAGKHIFGGKSQAMEAAGLGLEQLLYLDDLGIISGVLGLQTLRLTLPFQTDAAGVASAAIACNEKALVFLPEPESREEVSITGYPISVVGRELLKLASCRASVDYLREVADAVRDECKKISIGEVSGRRGTGFRVNITDDI